MRGPIAVLAAAVFTLLARDAAATCVQLECKPTTLERPDGSALELGGQRVGAHLSVDYVARAEPISSGGGFDFAEDWDDREDLVWEAGSGFWLGISANEGARASVSPGVVAFLGLHTMVEWPRERHEKWSMPEVEATRWCAPIACLGLGLIVAPTGVVLGNEIGAELRGVYGAETREGDGSLARISVRPVFRYARGALRTQSFVGFLLPELGAQLREGEGPAFAMAWSIYPIDWRVDGPLALSLDPLRVGALIAPESGVSVDVGGELGLRFAP